MMIATIHETGNETRVAITPQSAKQYIKKGFNVAIENDAGLAAGFLMTNTKKLAFKNLMIKIPYYPKPKYCSVLMSLLPKTWRV